MRTGKHYLISLLVTVVVIMIVVVIMVAAGLYDGKSPLPVMVVALFASMIGEAVARRFDQ